jgi:hypothetical protein
MKVGQSPEKLKHHKALMHCAKCSRLFDGTVWSVTITNRQYLCGCCAGKFSTEGRQPSQLRQHTSN